MATLLRFCTYFALACFVICSALNFLPYSLLLLLFALQNKRTEDIFARYGGEEFIILPRGEIHKKDMRVQCERIRKAVEKFEFCLDGVHMRITVSLGFHLLKVEGSDVEAILHELIRKADQALYLAKERGRNRTESLL